MKLSLQIAAVPSLRVSDLGREIYPDNVAFRRLVFVSYRIHKHISECTLYCRLHTVTLHLTGCAEFTEIFLWVVNFYVKFFLENVTVYYNFYRICTEFFVQFVCLNNTEVVLCHSYCTAFPYGRKASDMLSNCYFLPPVI